MVLLDTILLWGIGVALIVLGRLAIDELREIVEVLSQIYARTPELKAPPLPKPPVPHLPKAVLSHPTLTLHLCDRDGKERHEIAVHRAAPPDTYTYPPGGAPYTRLLQRPDGTYEYRSQE